MLAVMLKGAMCSRLVLSFQNSEMEDTGKH